MGIAIKVENLGKAYQLGEIGTGTLSRDLERYWAKLRGKEDPFLKIGETNDRTKKGESDIVWSLKDLNFEIEQGDAIGIIGRNGAGKSTLLKILSRVTSPTTGSVKIKGRVASLLEVGTGFHPELTGRENIFLNGAILGMRKAEIKKHFDAIVDFAGIERYVDTPVKRYSSGMYVRLAFAVAAHLESEILVVDEVLAVGDAEFQKKCLGKMGEVNKSEGRTVLFVSHNMGAIKTLCKKGILLQNGLLRAQDDIIDDIIDLYLEQSFENNISIPLIQRKDRSGNSIVRITDLCLKDTIGENNLSLGKPMVLRLSYEGKERDFRGKILISINNQNGQTVLFLDSATVTTTPVLFTRDGSLEIMISSDFALPYGRYFVNVAFLANDEMADYVQSALIFNIIEGRFFETAAMPTGKSICYIKQKWNYKETQ